MGRCILIHEEKPVVNDRILEPHEVEPEIRRFDAAIDEARKELTELREKVLQEVGESEARVFDAHLLFLGDHELMGNTRKAISEERKDAGFLLRRRSEELS